MKRETTTKLVRISFLSAFALLTLFGIMPERNGGEYIPHSTNPPVFSHTIDVKETASMSDGNAIYVLSQNDTQVSFPDTGAQSAAVISADTGEAVFLKNADTRLPMASTTKIMTALVAMENLSTDTVFTVPKEVCFVEGSSIYLAPGEKITVMDLLYGLLLESGNDAACALAVACCSDVDSFVALMNKRAREMGLVNTHFDNPHGLSSENHYTTARELAIIAYNAMKNPLFRKIAGTKNYTVKGESGEPLKYFSNHNRMLGTYSGATGIKTGYTIASGRCLVTSAKRDGSEFIAVTLNDRSDFRDHAAMLDAAFENYRSTTLVSKGQIFGFFGSRVMENTNSVVILEQKSSATGKRDFTVKLSESKRTVLPLFDIHEN